MNGHAPRNFSTFDYHPSRPDNGMLKIDTDASETGMLEVLLSPQATLDNTQGVVRIEASGSVFIN